MRLNSKGRILAAATYEFSNNEYEAVTIKNIAQRAKVSPGNIYVFFKDKESLLKCAIEDTMHRIQDLSMQYPDNMEQFFDGLLTIAIKEKYSMHCIVNTASAHEKLINCIARQILHGYPEYKDADKNSLMKENSHLAACAALTMIIEMAGHRNLYMKNDVRMDSVLDKTVDGIMTSAAYRTIKAK
jgi:AcrR family transcriptional regulator